MSNFNGKPIPENIRFLIKQQLNANMSITNISKIFNLSRPTIYKIKNDIQAASPGRIRSYNTTNLTIQIKHSIKKQKKQKKRVTAKNIKKDLSENISLRTLQRFLHDSSMFTLFNNKRKIILTEKQKDVRVSTVLSWFQKNINFNEVVYSDECRFSLDGPDNFMSWEIDNEEKCYTRFKRPCFGGSIMIYGYILKDGYLGIRKIDGTLTGLSYADLMKNDILPEIRSKVQTSFHYQQDNARPHIAKHVMRMFLEEQVSLLEWPAHSPDLNIIEYVWKILKDRIYDNTQFMNKSELWAAIQNKVYEMNHEEPSPISRLYESIVTNYLNVIQHNGSN